MKIITTIILLLGIISITVAQTKEIDYKLYEKIESGQYSTQAYLKGLIENKYIEDDFKSFFADNNNENLLAIGLIKSILTKDYDGLYQNTGYFENLRYTEFENIAYFYESCTIKGNSELFIWGNFDKETDSFNLQSRIVSNLEPTSYKFEIIRTKSKKFISFKADELVVIGTEESSNWTTIKYTIPNDINFIGTYRDCFIENDTTIKCKRLQWKGKSDDVSKNKRVFTSPLYFEDLDNNGSSEFYWFAVSDGSLVYFECFDIVNLDLRERDNSGLIEHLKTTSIFMKYLGISKMEIKPKI